MTVKISCMGIVMAINTDDNQVLIMNNSGEWVFPKGHVQANESLVQAACREIFEETGITVTESQCKGQVDTFSYFFEGEQAQKRIEVFLFVIPQIQLIKVNAEEGFIEGIWLSPNEVTARLTHKDAREAFAKALSLLQ